MTAIIAFTGKKQSGKNTTANYLIGELLVKNDVISRFEISDDGELLVPTKLETGEIIMGVLDMTRKDNIFKTYAQKLVWPHVKMYNFADPLKEICVDVLGLTHEQCNGTDAEKSTTTHIKWENMPHYGRLKYTMKSKVPKGNMTAREVMQQMGTEVFRKMHFDCWTQNCIKRILTDAPKVAIVCDCRFPNEAQTIKDAGGKLVRLLRKTDESTHASEVSLDEPAYDQSNFDIIVNNTEITKFQAYQEVRSKLLEWGIVS